MAGKRLLFSAPAKSRDNYDLIDWSDGRKGRACTSCHGWGFKAAGDDEESWQLVDCPACGGTGKQEN